MKIYLLTAGDRYYPGKGESDWIGCFDSFDEVNKQIQEILVDNRNSLFRGKKIIEEKKYKIKDNIYDWYEIIDLKKWIFK